MNKIFPILFFILPFIVQAQEVTLYSWKSGNVQYEAIYFKDQDAQSKARVNYQSKDQEILVEYSVRNASIDIGGESYDALDGFDVSVIRGEEVTYYPDNVIFNNTPYDPSTIDDRQLGLEHPENELVPLTRWETLQLEELTKQELDQFFDPSHAFYNKVNYNLVIDIFDDEEDVPDVNQEIEVVNDLKDVVVDPVTPKEKTWGGIMSKGTGYSTQSYKLSASFPKAWIAEKWDAGFSITSVSYGAKSTTENVWVVVMSKGTGFSGQSWKTADVFPVEWLQSKLDEGKRITSLSHGGGYWAIVVNKGTGYTQQYSYERAELNQASMNEIWNKGLYLTAASYGDGKWIYVASSVTDYQDQEFILSASYPKDWIANQWDKSYYITTIAYGKGGWFVVMSKGAGFTRQRWRTHTDEFPASWVRESWDNNYYITEFTSRR